jgi:ubiquinone/menaquinone biosynthesis C-methylase UbiE
MAETQFRESAAAGYDRSVGEMTQRIVPLLLRAARLAPGMRVLDIATGTGLAAELALAEVGPTGHVTAADLSPAMTAKARARLAARPNVSVTVEDGQALTLTDQSFDAVICNMGLMYFPDPARGLAEFRRVLRPGGRAAVSVFTSADRALVGGLIRVAIARHFPSKAAEAERFFAVGDEARLRSAFEGAGFTDVEIATEALTFAFASFDAYFGGAVRGDGLMGQEYLALPEGMRRAVREEVRRDVGDTGGPIEVKVEVRIASGGDNAAPPATGRR